VLASLGVVLLNVADERNVAIERLTAQGLLVVGGATLPLGILGGLAAKREETHLLQLHAALVAMLSLGFATLCVLLLVGGAESLRPSLERMVVDAPSSDDDKVDRLVGLLQTHRASLSAASVLGLFLLAMDGTMAVGLGWIVAGHIDLNEDSEYQRVRGSTMIAVAEGEEEEEQQGDMLWPDDWRVEHEQDHAGDEAPACKAWLKADDEEQAFSSSDELKDESEDVGREEKDEESQQESLSEQLSDALEGDQVVQACSKQGGAPH